MCNYPERRELKRTPSPEKPEEERPEKKYAFLNNRNCPRCSKPVIVTTQNKSKKFCSRKCQHLYWQEKRKCRKKLP
jgi:hypothetical protein